MTARWTRGGGKQVQGKKNWQIQIVFTQRNQWHPRIFVHV